MVTFSALHGLPLACNDNTRTRTPLAYVSACCPSGWNTVWGFIATTNPALIDLMDRVPGVVDPDEAWLDQACEMAGVEVVTVPACLWLQSHGITESRVYPLDLLTQRLG